nr:hypothetical protein [Cytophagales bacterium]
MTVKQEPRPSLPAPLRKIKTALTNPGTFFRSRSNFERKVYYSLSRFMHFRTRAQRCVFAANNNMTFEIKDNQGYAILRPDEVPDGLAQAVIDEVMPKIQNIDIKEFQKTAYKPYLLNILKATDFSRDSAVYKLASHPRIVDSVSRYLKCYPILTSIAVLYSPNEAKEEQGSQKYHLDHEDLRQVKAFMLINDVDEDCGPFTFISAEYSDAVQTKIGYKMDGDEKRVEDEGIYSIVSKEDAKSLMGPAGTLGLVDASRCFHYGSRAGKKPRIMLTFQYLTPFAYVMPWNWRQRQFLTHLRSEDMSSRERKLLGVDI